MVRDADRVADDVSAAEPTPQPYVLPRPATPAEGALVRLIGPQPALKLVEAYGGTTMDVPRGVDRGSQLPDLIGLEAAKILVQHHGGGRLRVPMARAWRAVIYRQRDGLSHREIAQKLGANDRSVWRWLNEAGETKARPR